MPETARRERYHHGAPRGAAVAVHAGDVLHERLVRVTGDGSPARRLAAASAEYVRFAAEQRPLFQALYGAGLDKRRPDLRRMGERIGALFLAPARQICGTDEHAQRLTSAVTATAHGHATLLVDHGVDENAPEDAAAAVRALVAGRRWLT